MQIVIKGKTGQWIKATKEYERIIAHAATSAVRQTGIAARDAARRAIAVAGFGSTWQRSMRSKMLSGRNDVLNPMAWVHSTINFSDVFEYGKTIIGMPWLWIPLPLVPIYPGTGRGDEPRRQMTPKIYIQSVGPLRSAGNRNGKPPLLLGLMRAGPSGKPTRKFKGGVRGTRGELQWVPMFVGVSTARIEARFNTVDAMEMAADQMAQYYQDNLEAYEGRK